jgi:catechol 2,3-dioxygenase-like lactoylglutathione lyase family enzyme
MLGEHPITLVLLAKDLAAAREFYHGKLGLPIVREDGNAIVFRCGSVIHLDVTKSTTGTVGQQTQAARQVSDIRTEVAELRDRGIKIEDYGTPGPTTEVLADEAELDSQSCSRGARHRPRGARV